MRDYLRLAIVSPETLSITLLAATWLFAGQMYAAFGHFLLSTTVSDLPKYLTTIVPAGTLAFSVSCSRLVLFPLANNRELVRWPDYPKLKARVMFGVGVNVASTILGIGVLLFYSAIRVDVLAILVLLAIIPGALAAFTLYFASIDVRQILEDLDSK